MADNQQSKRHVNLDALNQHEFAHEMYIWDEWFPGMPVMVCEDKYVGCDTETTLIQNSYDVPDLVIAGFISRHRVQLVNHKYFKEYFKEFTRVNPNIIWLFLNGPFDIQVMNKVLGSDDYFFECLRDDRVIEIQANYIIHRMATVGWFVPRATLAMITKELLNVDLNKSDDLRLCFEVDKEPTFNQKVYLVEDCCSTYRTGKLLVGQPTEFLQAKANYVLNIMSKNGLPVDVEYLHGLQKKLADEMSKLAEELKAYGYYVKNELDDLTGAGHVHRIMEMLAGDKVDEFLSELSVQFRKKQSIIIAAYLYACVQSNMLCSDIDAAFRRLLLVLAGKLDEEPSTDKKSKKSKVQDNLYKWAEGALRQLLDEHDCLECLDGLGDCKATRSKPFFVFADIILSGYLAGKPSSDLTWFWDEFKEQHEINFGWLKISDKVSPTKFIQNHIKELMKRNPQLKLPYTDASAANIEKYYQGAMDLLDKSGVEYTKEDVINSLDVSDLAVYRCSSKLAWMFEDAGVDDPFLNLWMAYKHREKLLSTYVTDKYLEGDGRNHPHFILLVKTGRTGASSPPVQQYPREIGLREQYKAPPGKVLSSCDYSQLEICTLAQTLLSMYGESRMAKMLQAGFDLHGWFAAVREGEIPVDGPEYETEEGLNKLKAVVKTYKSEAKKGKRQNSKMANFGFQGGMRAPTFYINCREQGANITLEECEKLYEDWYNAFPEMNRYVNPVQDGEMEISKFNKNKKKIQDEMEDADSVLNLAFADETIQGKYEVVNNKVKKKGDTKTVKLFRAMSLTGRARVRATYTSACNYPFQSLASDCAKLALWYVFMYAREKHFKMINFIHDEIICELDYDDTTEEVVTHISQLMLDAAKVFLPDIPMKADPALMFRWQKSAETAYDDDGHLIPWEVHLELEKKKQEQH